MQQKSHCKLFSLRNLRSLAVLPYDMQQKLLDGSDPVSWKSQTLRRTQVLTTAKPEYSIAPLIEASANLDILVPL